jgi:hypothetical protein
MQEEKQLNPASRRVRDAAEHLLSVVMEQVAKKKYRGANQDGVNHGRRNQMSSLLVILFGVVKQF